MQAALLYLRSLSWDCGGEISKAGSLGPQLYATPRSYRSQLYPIERDSTTMVSRLEILVQTCYNSCSTTLSSKLMHVMCKPVNSDVMRSLIKPRSKLLLIQVHCSSTTDLQEAYFTRSLLHKLQLHNKQKLLQLAPERAWCLWGLEDNFQSVLTAFTRYRIGYDFPPMNFYIIGMISCVSEMSRHNVRLGYCNVDNCEFYLFFWQ